MKVLSALLNPAICANQVLFYKQNQEHNANIPTKCLIVSFPSLCLNYTPLFLQLLHDISFQLSSHPMIQSNFGRSNSPVSNTRDRSNSFVGPGNFPIHLMLKYTPGSNSDGSNSRTQSMVRRAIFHVKTLWWLEPNISLDAWFKFIIIFMSAPWQWWFYPNERNVWSN